MAPSVASSRSQHLSPAHPAYDRVFYSGMAIALALTVFVGFAPTYYLRSYFGAPITANGSTSLTLLAHVHAVVFTGWVLLVLVQTALIARHRVALHQRMGIAGATLAIVMMVVGSATAIKAAARGAAPLGVNPLVFMAIPLADMVVFAGFIGTAMWWRRNKETHKRLMLLAYISLVAAAVARLPGMLPLGPLAFFGFAFLFVVAGMLYDVISRGRIHRAYILGGALFVASVPLRLMISGTATWHRFAEFLVGR
ncbi:MAG: hypothetical protein AB7O65_01350 [Candidatus Korobacteraceae bacterium]